MQSLVFLPCVNMREGPSLETRVVSQALFGETVELKERLGDWTLIQTPDGYTGWVKEGIIERREPYTGELEVTRLQSHLYGVPDTEFGPLLTLPFGSKLLLLEERDARWLQVGLPNEKTAFIQRGDVEKESFELISFSKKFLGLPYTWGGRSSFGFDCSGFVQMLYSRLGVCLPRDARQQILCGKPVALDGLQLGDLLFWGFSETDIRHVGMFLEKGIFIHTSSRENKPYLRLNQIADPEWNGSKIAFYPFRTVRRILPGKNPEKEEGAGNFRADEHEKAVKMAIDKSLHADSPVGYTGSCQGKAQNPSYGKTGCKRNDSQMKDSAH